ncbi:MAG: DUF5103 domain-containing protein [Bacteroidota bacterium]
MARFLTLLLLFIFISSGSIYAQKKKKNDTTKKASADYYEQNFLRYNDYVYKNNIRSVRLHKVGWVTAAPILEMGSDLKILLSFDDLDADHKTFAYTVVHCDAQWQPSDLMQSEYIDGFPENYISYYAFSFNTIQRYSHYELQLPNENMKLTRSGNYLLKVYAEGNPDDVILTRRFVVLESSLSIQAGVRKSASLKEREAAQEVYFTINTGKFSIADPYSDLKIVVLKNWRWDNAFTTAGPKMIRGSELVYDFPGDIIFPGGNEYRYFDTRTLKIKTQRVQSYTIDSSKLYTVNLYCEEKRSKNYYTFNDINGNYSIDNLDGFRDDNLDAEYNWVSFCLRSEEPVDSGGVYVFGGFTDWECRPEGKMKYNQATGTYDAKIFLKQGYYNYSYALLENRKKEPLETPFEGSFNETENEYTILVYYRAPGTIYDKLIGLVSVNSMKF